MCIRDRYKGQRDAIRNAIQDTDSNWYKLIMNLYQLDPGVRKVFFRNFIVNASLKGSADVYKRQLQHWTWTKHVLVERLVIMISLENRALQCVQKRSIFDIAV